MAKDAGLLIIGDAKRGDISSTAAAYAQAILSPDGPLGCDAITLNPWMGSDTLSPFVSVCQDHGRGLFALVRTTNPGSALLQHHGTPTAAHHLANTLHNLGTDLCGPRRLSAVGAVVGASAADEAKVLRQLMPEAWFLVPGIGAQGGSADQALAGCRKDGMGALPVASRSVLFPNKPSVSYDTDPEGFIASQVETLTGQVREVWQ